eukprot:scaffold898_cov229-Pinguiococcus_pyrenoidosus.AAC.17
MEGIRQRLGLEKATDDTYDKSAIGTMSGVPYLTVAGLMRDGAATVAAIRTGSGTIIIRRTVLVQKKVLHNTRASHVVPHRSTGRA